MWHERLKNPQTGWWAWSVLLSVITGMLLLGDQHTVTTAYRPAALNWLSGEALYNTRGTGFLYLPHAAILFLPYAMLPHLLGEILWRCTTVGLFATGVWRLSQTAPRGRDEEFFPVMSLVTIPLAFSAARNGQSTLPMAAMMMLAAADLAESRWWRTTLWLSLGIAIKPLMIVMLLLAAAMHRQLWWRLPVGMAVIALAPFALQSPDYVWTQYVECQQMLRTASRIGQTVYWAEPFCALEVLTGIVTPERLRLGLRLIAAAATLSTCLWLVRRRGRQMTAVALFTLAAAYILLCNPRSEGNTYALIAPAYGLFWATAFWRSQPLSSAVMAVISVGTLGHHELGKFVTPREQSIWLAPLMGLAFLGYLVILLRRSTWHAADESAAAGFPATAGLRPHAASATGDSVRDRHRAA